MRLNYLLAVLGLVFFTCPVSADRKIEQISDLYSVGSVVRASEQATEQYSPQLRSAFLGQEVWQRETPIKRQLQQHFVQVLKVLVQQNESSLKESFDTLESEFGTFSESKAKFVRNKLRQRRDWQIRTLYKYAVRGQFPKNEWQSPSAIPIFVDDYETHCAVGYLMHKSGHDAAVAQIVEENNLVFVNDVRHGPLVEWVKFSGLSQQEAAMIQPAYAPPNFQATLADFDDPNFSVSANGTTVSALSVLNYSYSSNSGDSLETVFSTGVAGVNSSGSAYADVDRFGLAIGAGNFDFFQPSLENWVFLGVNDFDTLGAPSGNNDAIIYRVDYRIVANQGVFSQLATTSDITTSGNFLGLSAQPDGNLTSDGFLRIATEVSDISMNVLDTGSIETTLGSPEGLSGTTFLNTNSNGEIFVTSYALDFRNSGGLSSGGLSSLWNEFEIQAVAVPEPSCSILIIGFSTLMLRRRRMCC